MERLEKTRSRWFVIFFAMSLLVMIVFPSRVHAQTKWLKQFRKDSLLNTYKTCYAVTADTLWVGTNGDGVMVRYADGSEKFFNNRNTRSNTNNDDGLMADYITSIVVDESKGFVWIGTKSGLAGCNLDGKEWVRFTEKDGLPNMLIRDVDIDSAGNLWIGTPSGIVTYDGEKLAPVSYGDAQGSIHSIKVKGESVWVGTVSGTVSCFKDGKWATMMTY